MKKITFILLLSILSMNISAQISFGPKHRGKQEKFKKGTLEKVKSSKTIFVLPDFYNVDDYQKIIKENYDIGNYEIILDSEVKTLELVEKSNENLSIFRFVGQVRTKYKDGVAKGTYLYTHFSMVYYDVINFKKETASINKEKKRKKYLKSLYYNNASNIARIVLYPNDKLGNKLISSGDKTFYDIEKDKFYNFNLGFFKNYIQDLSSLINKGEEVWLYDEKKYTPKLKELSTKTIYVPSYLQIKYNGWKRNDSEPNSDNVEKAFSEYEYKYEVIDDKVLNDKILKGEEFYYLRYVRRNTERFLNIVNSKTGESIYKDYRTGLSYNLKKDYFNDLSKRIKKVSKK